MLSALAPVQLHGRSRSAPGPDLHHNPKTRLPGSKTKLGLENGTAVIVRKPRGQKNSMHLSIRSCRSVLAGV